MRVIRKQENPIIAVRIANLHDVQDVVDSCPHIYGVSDLRYAPESLLAGHVSFALYSDSLRINFMDYLLWDTGEVWAVRHHDFLEDYEAI